MTSSGSLRLTIGPQVLTAVLEVDHAPATCEAVRRLLPLRGKLLQGRWSGESAWMPLEDLKIDVGYENHTSHPAPGELLLYCFGLSVTEILVPYGPTIFGSRVGQLAGNHFATVVDGRERLQEIGRLVLWEGAQDILIEEA